MTPNSAISSSRSTGAALLAFTLLAAVTSPARAADWPAYKHDAQRTSVTGESLSFPLRAAWQYVSPQAPSPAWPDVFRLENRTDFDYAPQPVLADGIVCFGSSSDDTVRALDANTGKERWLSGAGGAPVTIDRANEYSFARSDRVVHLGVSASGARYDAMAESTAGRPEDRRWNADWKSEARADDTGRVIQLAIPWKTIVAAGLKKDRLALNFQMNQKDTSGESPRNPGKPALPKSTATSSEALSYLGILGREHCLNFGPLGLGSPPKIDPRRFTGRLHFAEPDDIEPGRRIFDVKLQDKLVVKGLDVVRESGGVRTALVKEFKNIPAFETLALEFIAAAREVTATSAPILSGLEVFEEGFLPR